MKLPEFESHIAGAINAVLKSGGHPTIIAAILDAKKLELQILQMKAQNEPTAHTPDSPIIRLDGSRPPIGG